MEEKQALQFIVTDELFASLPNKFPLNKKCVNPHKNIRKTQIIADVFIK